MGNLGAKLIGGWVASLAAVLLWLGIANLRVLREDLEAAAVVTEERLAGVILHATRSSMLRNDRSQLIEVVRSIGTQPDIKSVRIFDKAGRIRVSTTPGETGTAVDRRMEACQGCHDSGSAVAKPKIRDTFRLSRMGNERVSRLVLPIRNEPACSNAACHAHAASDQVLGTLDVVSSLDRVDQALAAHERTMRAQVIVAAVAMAAIAGILVLLVVRRPIKRLIAGVRQLGGGNLGFRFGFGRKDEIGELAAAFDSMAAGLETANRTLEDRIAEKTRELESAQATMIHSEKLASLGQLSAAVAHEINNPLAGIFTYARLIEKKLAPEKPVSDWLETIQHESRRCGDIVSNLLVFARKQRTEMVPSDLRKVIERTIAVVEHKLHMHRIALASEAESLPLVRCDAAQIEQVLVAITMNAVDAILSVRNADGRIRISARALGADRVDLSVANNGPPIPKNVLPHVFEPFFSTKQATSGVGLGLAVAYGIVKRHGGEIQVETGPETVFHVILPAGEPSGWERPLSEERDVRTEAVDTHRG